jgi:hypothetical protein
MATKKKKITVGTVAMPTPSNISEVPSVYINNAQILAAGSFDVRLGLNEVSTEDGGKSITLLRKANVVMSVPHFLAMVKLLNTQAKAILAAQQSQVAEAAQPGKA